MPILGTGKQQLILLTSAYTTSTIDKCALELVSFSTVDWFIFDLIKKSWNLCYKKKGRKEFSLDLM